jgi:hypothetical protein
MQFVGVLCIHPQHLQQLLSFREQFCRASGGEPSQNAALVIIKRIEATDKRPDIGGKTTALAPEEVTIAVRLPLQNSTSSIGTKHVSMPEGIFRSLIVDRIRRWPELSELSTFCMWRNSANIGERHMNLRILTARALMSGTTSTQEFFRHETLRR